MVMFLPECAVCLCAIASLPTAASDQLHAIADNLWTGVSNQNANVVAGHYVIAISELAEGQIPILSNRLERSAAIERLEHLERLELTAL